MNIKLKAAIISTLITLGALALSPIVILIFAYLTFYGISFVIVGICIWLVYTGVLEDLMEKENENSKRDEGLGGS